MNTRLEPYSMHRSFAQRQAAMIRGYRNKEYPTTDDVGNKTRVDFGNGTWQTFSYGTDARYMATGIDYAYKCNSGDTITNKGGIRLTRTNGGNPLSWADNTDKFIKTFSYDTQGRLANADIPGISRTDYGYDWVGNRTSPTAVYNDADQLTSYSGNSYSYNTYGDMTSGAGRTYTTADNGKVWRITYNSVNYDNYFITSGLRYNSSVGAVSTNYVYDVTAGIPAVVAEANGGTVTNYYVREPNGALVMRQNGADSKYYHFDELGSTLFLTDASGVQTDKYVYNAWGKVVSSSGSTVNPYKYVGRLGYYSDAGTGLLLLSSRFYDPEAGVFTQRDEAKDGLSYYAYTSGNVKTAVDPWGKGEIDLRDCSGLNPSSASEGCKSCSKCVEALQAEGNVSNILATATPFLGGLGAFSADLVHRCGQQTLEECDLYASGSLCKRNFRQCIIDGIWEAFRDLIEERLRGRVTQ